MKPLSILIAWMFAAPGWASNGSTPVPPCESHPCSIDATVGRVDLRMHNKAAQDVLNGVLHDATFWQGASHSSYDKKLYDEIRLKDTSSGYVPMITGEGDEDYPAEVVADIVFRRNTDIPRHMSGAKAVVNLGSGYDSSVGAEYRDSFYLLDLTVFYGHFAQRMYRKYDESQKQHVMWFEKLDESFVDAATWAAYQAKMTQTIDNLDKRWAFNSIIEVTDVYGMFVVTPGEELESRVTFVSKLTFGDGTGFIAKVGSQMPMVIKAGLKSGFDACVAIARDEKHKRLGSPAP
ncbi:MAG TPA: hypothetical protein ENK18_26330 [Deltaproteobacteria bacterium]|nr:hypothetical protein [Deltaproteobacteria bacterium]